MADVHSVRLIKILSQTIKEVNLRLRSANQLLNCSLSLGDHVFTSSVKVGSQELYMFPKHHFVGLVQERRNSIANALELRVSCTNPSTCVVALTILEQLPELIAHQVMGQ